MDDNWLDQHVGPETQIRSEFEEQLAATLVSTWRDEPVVMPGHHDGAVRRRPWQAIGWAAAAVVLLAGVGAVVATRREPLGGSVHSPAPVTTVAPEPSPSTVPGTEPPPTTAAPSTTATPSTTDAPSTTTVREPLPTDLTIPREGGDVVQPDVLATIPVGSGPGQLALQNGEFTIPIAVLPDSILVFEDIPFQGLTGRVPEFGRDGLWRRDLTIDAVAGYAGATPLWVEASPNGTVFVTGLVEEGDGESPTVVWALRVEDDRLVLVDSGRTPGLPPGQLHLTEEGAWLGDEVVIFMETGVASDDVTTAAETPPQIDRVVLTRGTGPTPQTWVIDVPVPGDPGSMEFVGRSGAFGGGAWFSTSTTSNPEIHGPFVAILGESADEHVWFRTAEWGLAAADHEQLLFTKVTTDGLVLAVWPNGETNSEN